MHTRKQPKIQKSTKSYDEKKKNTTKNISVYKEFISNVESPRLGCITDGQDRCGKPPRVLQGFLIELCKCRLSGSADSRQNSGKGQLQSRLAS